MSLRNRILSGLPRLPPKITSHFSSSSSDENEGLAPPTPPRHRKSSRLPIVLVFIIATVGGLLHCGHVATVHNNHLSFSLLTNTERELTFFSENAFYYSFFKQLITADSFWGGLTALLNDTQTEYPQQFGCLTKEKGDAGRDYGYLPNFANCSSLEAPLSVPPINALQRFNIYPEVLMAGLYRTLRHFDLLSADCFQVFLEEINTQTAFVAAPEHFIVNDGSNGEVPPMEPMSTHSGDTIISCDGALEPPTFYVNCVFLLSGLTVAALTFSGWQLASTSTTQTNSNSAFLSVWGAILPFVGFFTNHGEATRVQWNPPLRESAYPLFLVQQAYLIWLLKGTFHRGQRHLLFKYSVYILLLVAMQLPWQFAQFVLLTQLLSLVATYGVIILSHSNSSLILFSLLASRLQELVVCQIIALLLSALLQFGNSLLITSAYLPLLFGCLAGIALHLRALRKVSKRKLVSWQGGCIAHLLWIGLVILSTSGSLFVSIRLLAPGSSSDDGAHIFDLLKVKLLNSTIYRTFHTQLYTCSAEFDFPGWSSINNLTHTGLLPLVCFAVFIASVEVLQSSSTLKVTTSAKHLNMIISPHSTTGGEKNNSTPPSVSPLVLVKETSRLIADLLSTFVVHQLLAFGILASLIMRLKLLFVPQLCLTLAILAQPHHFFGSHKLHLLVIRCLPTFSSPSDASKFGTSPSSASKISWTKIILLHSLFASVISFQWMRGVDNLQSEWNKLGQFSAYTHETLLLWTKRFPARLENRPWVFSGTMPEMAMLRLGLITSNTSFAITNHPHYENQLIRERTELAYAVSSRKPIESVWRIYRHVLKAEFIVIPAGSCSQPDWLNYRPGCSSSELWDILDPQFAENHSPTVCQLALNSSSWLDWPASGLSPYFSLVFRALDVSLVVLRVNPLSI